MTTTSDFLIIGGGILGLTLALELRRRHEDATISILEKENTFGQHASGRNSGVLHAGIYYPKDSLKSRLLVTAISKCMNFVSSIKFQCDAAVS